MELDLVKRVVLFNHSEIPFVLDGANDPWFYGNKLAEALGFVDFKVTVKKCVDIRDRKSLKVLLREVQGGDE